MSVALNAAIESYAFLWPDCRPWRQNASRMPSEISAPSRLLPKNGPSARSR